MAQNGFSVPIFWQRGDGEEAEREMPRKTEVGGGGGRGAKRWGHGVHLAPGPRDGLTAAGAGIRLLTLGQFALLSLLSHCLAFLSNGRLCQTFSVHHYATCESGCSGFKWPRSELIRTRSNDENNIRVH